MSVQKSESDTSKVSDRSTSDHIPSFPKSSRMRGTLFTDVDAAKKKIQASIANNERKASGELYKTHGRAQKIARSPAFEYCTLAVIALNSIWIAIDLDYNTEEHLWNAKWYFIVVENIFCLFFTAEVCVRFAAYKRKVDCLFDPWFLFDSALVFLMVMETWVSFIFWLVFQMTIQGGGILAVLRLLRLARIARVARLMRAVPELMVLIKGMLVATRSVFFTLIMLFGVIYIFAIIFCNTCADTDLEVYFSSVGWSMFNLIAMGLYMDGVLDLMTAFNDHSVWLLLLFMLFLFISTHTILNLLIGVLCENVTVIAVTEKFELLVLFVRDRMIWIIENHGIDPTRISKQDFLTIVQDEEAILTFAEMDVDPVGLIDFTDIIFREDVVSEDGTMVFPTFMDVMLSFRGTNAATVKDLARIQKFLVPHFAKINDRLDQLADKVSRRNSEGGEPMGPYGFVGADGGGFLVSSGTFAQGSFISAGSGAAAAPAASPAGGISFQEMRPDFEVVIKRAFAESFGESISPQLSRLATCIANISSKLDESLDQALAEMGQLGSSGAQGAPSAVALRSTDSILSTLTELKNKLHQGHSEALTLGGGDNLPSGVTSIFAEEERSKPSPFSLGSTATSRDEAPLPPTSTGIWRASRSGQSTPPQDIPMLPQLVVSG